MPHKRELTQEEINEINNKAQKIAERNQNIKVDFYRWKETIHESIEKNNASFAYKCDPVIVGLEAKLLEADYSYNDMTIEDVTGHITGMLTDVDKFLTEKKNTKLTGEKKMCEWAEEFKKYLQDKVIKVFYTMNEMSPEEKKLPMKEFNDVSPAVFESRLKEEKYAEIDGIEFPQKDPVELPAEDEELFAESEEVLTTEKVIREINKKFKTLQTNKEKFIYVSNILAAIKNKQFLHCGIDDEAIEDALKTMLVSDAEKMVKKDMPKQNNQEDDIDGVEINENVEKKAADLSMQSIMLLIKNYAFFMADISLEVYDDAQKNGPEAWFTPKAYAFGSLNPLLADWGMSFQDSLPEGTTLMGVVEDQKMKYLANDPEKLKAFDDKLLDRENYNPQHPEIKNYKGIDDFRSEFTKKNPELAAYYERKAYKETFASLPAGMFSNRSYVNKISTVKDLVLNTLSYPALSSNNKLKAQLNEIAKSVETVVDLGNKMQKTGDTKINSLSRREMFQTSAESVAKALSAFMQKQATKPEWYDENHRSLKEHCNKLLGLLSNREAKRYRECEKSLELNVKNIADKAESNLMVIRNYIDYRQNGTFRLYNSASTLRKMMEANEPGDPKVSCNKIAKLIDDDFQLGKAFSLELAKQCVKHFNNGYEIGRRSTTRGFLKTMAERIPKEDIADFDIDIHAKSDDTKYYRGFESFDVKITYKPMLGMNVLNSVEKSVGAEFGEVKNLLTNKEDMDLFREMFNTKKSSLITNTGRYNNTKRALDDFFNKRDKLMRSLDEYQRRGIEKSVVDTEKIKRQTRALSNSMKELLPLLANYVRNSEKKSLDSYGQDAGVARIVGAKGMLNSFRSKSKELTDELAPENRCKNPDVSQKDRDGLEIQMERFTEAFRDAFSKKREDAAYDRHRRATATAVKKM